ncbi:MAG: tetratricopeptide repeat-containing serine protease family protein [Cyanobacteria bacterium P01_A01_bin.84]
MSNWRCLVVCGLTTLILSSCGKDSFPEIIEKVKKSTILIYDRDKQGHGTGLFIEGDGEGCHVLTARHVVPLNTKIALKTSDQKIWTSFDIQRFPNQDLALINFKVNNNNRCPYKALSVGNSDSVNILDDVYIAGFPGNSSELQLTSGKVSLINDQDVDGYGISYTAITASGMSGGPVINTSGKVIAVHGRTDVELARMVALKGKQLPSQQQSKGVNNSQLGDNVGTFKWGIPINAYLENVAQVRSKFQRVSQAKDFLNQGNDLYVSKDYETALEYYYKAIAIQSDDADVWFYRGNALGQLKRYRQAIASYDTATAIKPNYHQAWYNRGISLDNLKRYRQAIASYDKAVAIKPDYHIAWNNRGISLDNLKRYRQAIASYDKAIAIKSDDHIAWNNRGVSLANLKRYQEAIASYDKAIKLNPNDETAINNRKRLLQKIN